MRQRSAFLCQPVAHVVQLNDHPHQAIDPDGDQNRDPREDQDLIEQRRFRHNAEGDGDNFRGQNKIGANRPFHFVTLKGQRVTFRQRLKTLLPLRRVFLVLTRLQAVKDLLHPFKTEECASQHQQRRNRPGDKSTDQ